MSLWDHLKCQCRKVCWLPAKPGKKKGTGKGLPCYYPAKCLTTQAIRFGSAKVRGGETTTRNVAISLQFLVEIGDKYPPEDCDRIWLGPCGEGWPLDATQEEIRAEWVDYVTGQGGDPECASCIKGTYELTAGAKQMVCCPPKNTPEGWVYSATAT